jgi:Kdo2-lipid IVA lauroyltransferase/acyltransferase
MEILDATAPPIPVWMRLASRLPLSVLYGLASGLVFVAHRVLGLRRSVIRSNIAACFPDLSAQAVDQIVAGHYRQVGEMLAEVIKSATLSAPSMLDRVTIRNLALAQSWLGQGRPLLLVAAHQANWEWVLQALAMQLEYPLDVGYKPIRSGWAQYAMNALRRRFGAHLVPAKELLPDLLKRRQIVRGIAMLADQEPTTSEHQHWLTFLGRETAFYMGAEQMARAARYPALFVALRRLRRGYYEIEFKPLLEPGEKLEPGEFTTRYARFVEIEIRAAPSDWTWGHRRWKLKRGLYARGEL